MTLTAALMGKASQPSASAASNSSRDGDFGQVFSDVSKKSEASNNFTKKDYKRSNIANKSRNDSVRNGGQENESDTAVASDKNSKKADNSKPIDESQQNVENENINKTNETQENDKSQKSDKVTEKAEEAIVAEVAEALGISQDALMSILASLNIKPRELMDKQNVNLLVQELMGAENSIELLSMEGVQEMFETVEQGIAQALENKPVENQESTENIEIAELLAPKQTETSDIEENDQKVDNELYQGEVPKAESSNKPSSENGFLSNNNEGETQDSNIDFEANIDVNMQGQGNFNNVSKAIETAIARVRSPLNTAEVINQIIEKVKVDIKPGISEIKLILKPESLGEVSLRISSENGIITAQFVAESQRVKEIIEAEFNQLRDVLNEQGINVMELSVSVSQDDSQQQMQEFLQGRAKSQTRISSIISSIEGEAPLLDEGLDEALIYENNVNYKA